IKRVPRDQLDSSAPLVFTAGVGCSREVHMVHPALRAMVDQVRAHPSPPPWTMDVAVRRAQYRAQSHDLWPDVDERVSTRDVVVTLPGRELAARLYVPSGDDGSALVVYFHGGSFVMGDLESHDAVVRRLASDTAMRYLAVGYRLAPEHPFPAAVDDAIAALRWAGAQRGSLGAPHAALVAMGDSAGATLATVGATLTRRDEHAAAAQVLLYPTMGPSMLTDSGHVYNTGFLLDLASLRYDYTQYLGADADPTDPRVSPLLFDDLAGAPPALVVVAECDPLRDEAVAYAGLLEHFAVPVELLEARGMLHGFLRLGGTVPASLDILDDVARHLRRSLAAQVRAPRADA
ncbi:MAG: alpha/beta hydrolase, partial [Acidimicrobiales bacterium]